MIRRGLLSLARVFTVVLAVSGFSLAQDGSFTAHHNDLIRGKVRSTSGRAVNNAIVELRVQGGAMIGQTVTDTEGDFEFPNLVAGGYEVAVRAAGYQPSVQYARFNHSPSENFEETLNVEVIVVPVEERILGTPGTSFAQDVPRAAKAVYEKAMSKLSEQEADEGIALLIQATQLYDHYFDAYYRLGAVYYSTGKLDDALKALEKAREINDKDSALYQLFGMVMLKEEKTTIAEYAFKQSAVLDPTRAAPHYYRALALTSLARQEQAPRRTSDLAQAEKELDLAWDLSNRKLFRVHLQKATIDEIRGDREAEIAELREYLKDAPNEKDSAEVRKILESVQNPKKD